MKINFIARGCVPVDELKSNERYCASLGLKRLGVKVGAEPLAVVGGGHSVLDHLETLKQWHGGIWAINGAWKWCQENGIQADFFSIDPQPELLPLVKGVRKAYLASCCHPSVFDALKDADVTVFDTKSAGTDDGRLDNGPTSASTVPHVSCRAGYKHVTFFGCEGSYGDIGHANVYPVPVRENWIRVGVPYGCGQRVFLTDAELCMQTELLTAYLRALPDFYFERSGGFLGALVEAGQFDVVELSESMKANLVREPVSA